MRNRKRAPFVLAVTIAAIVGVVAPGGALEKKPRVTEFSTGITALGTHFDEPIDAAGVNRITAGADGNLWFIEEYGNRIGRITPKGKVTEFTVGISPGAFLSGISAGPDGNVWFTERGLEGFQDAGDVLPGRIGRITPKGEVTEFSAEVTPRTVCDVTGSCGDVSASPEAITAGPDGNLWFTERYAGRIGRITPDGVVTEFADGISTNGGGFRNPNWLGGITAGADGNLWFTEQRGELIGRITPAGVITEFPTGINYKGQGDGINAITAGPDGNVWFTVAEQLVRHIGRITPDGIVTLFPTPRHRPLGITSGPDGNLWFADSGGRIGRITPAGVISFFGAGITGDPSGIAAGCDGNLWFTELVESRIGRIDPGGKTRPALPVACPKKRN